MAGDVQVYEGHGTIESVDVHCHWLRQKTLPTSFAKRYRSQLVLDYQLCWLMDVALEKLRPSLYQTIELLNVFSTKKRYGVADPFPPPAGMKFVEAEITSLEHDHWSITMVVDHIDLGHHDHASEYGLEPQYG